MLELGRLPPAAFVPALSHNLGQLGPLHKVYDHFLSGLREHLEADAVWIRRSQRESETVVEDYMIGDPENRREDLISAFLRQARPAIPRNLLLAPLRVHGRTVGVVGAERHGREFERGRGWVLNRLASALAQELSRREDARIAQVLDSIKEKVLAELRPRDLAYQILDGLYQLVHYDHSAALLIYEPARHLLRVEADKIAWTKGKSAFIGHEILLPPELERQLTYPAPTCTFPEGGAEGAARPPLFDLLYFHRGDAIPEPRSILCAPLYFDGALLGLLKIAARRRLPFDRRDMEVAERFLPAAAMALRNARERVSLQNQALQAEIRAGLVTLARAVAHDVNNAIGTLLPLAEQVRDDLRSGGSDRKTLAEDMDVVIDKALLCKRIFGNMLRHGAERQSKGLIDVHALIEEMMPLLESYVLNRNVRIALDLGPGFPAIQFGKAHLERILWNLVTNAVEAIAGGPGTVSIETRVGEDGGAWLAVSDDGPGISEETASKIMEPFFTTKEGGTGLGLSICRALAWQYGGGLRVESRPGEGARAVLSFPAGDGDG